VCVDAAKWAAVVVRACRFGAGRTTNGIQRAGWVKRVRKRIHHAYRSRAGPAWRVLRAGSLFGVRIGSMIAHAALFFRTRSRNRNRRSRYAPGAASPQPTKDEGSSHNARTPRWSRRQSGPRGKGRGASFWRAIANHWCSGRCAIYRAENLRVPQRVSRIMRRIRGLSFRVEPG